MPRRIEARFTLVTPAFLGGAVDGDRPRPAEFRVPSLLGLLRFWWRTSVWRDVLDKLGPPPPGPWHRRYGNHLHELREREDRLFGAAGEGQGLVLASLHEVTQRPSQPAPQQGGAFYLAGQGLKGRGSLGRGTTFSLRFTVRPQAVGGTSENDLASLMRALRCLGLLGGVGARSRHGYGSLRLVSITDSDGELGWTEPDDVKAYGKELKKLLAEKWPADEPPFTAFSAAMRLVLVPATAGTGIDDFMEKQGHLIQHFRSKGRQNASGVYKVNGVDAQDHNAHPFKDDFTWFDNVINRRVSGGPKRAMFGLPHNYYSGRRGASATVGAVIPDEATGNASSDRRASPILLHFHALPDGRLAAVWLFLPARFLPDVPEARLRGPQLRVGVSANDQRPVDYTPSWEPIDLFYTHLLGEEPNAVSVLP